MKRFLMILGLVALSCQSFADTSQSITVTVSLDSVVSVSLDASAWVVGPIVLGGSNPSPTFTATNNGNVAIDLNIQGADGNGGWILDPTAGVDSFAVLVTNPAVALQTVPVGLATNVAMSGTQVIDMTYKVPTADTFGGGVDQGFSISVVASQHVP